MPSAYSYVERLGNMIPPVTGQQLAELRGSLPPVLRDCAFELVWTGDTFKLTLVRKKEERPS